MSVKQHIHQLGGETLIYGISGTINKFIALLLIPIYARVFTTAEYGVIATFTSFIGGIFIIVVLGLDMATARWFYNQESPQYRKSIISSWFWFQLGWGLIVGALIIVFARPILKILAIPQKYAPLILFISGIIFLQTFSKVTVNTFRLLRRPWTTLVYSASSMMLVLIGIILFVVVLKQGLRGFYIAQITMALMAAIGGALIIRAWIYPRSVVGPRLREMLRFGLPVVPVGVFQWIIMSSDRILLGNMTNSSEVGIYAIAWSLISPIGLLTASFAMAYGPFSMSLINHPSSRQVYAKVLTLYSVLGCLLCTAISLFALDIVDLITTPQYHAAAGLIPYLAFSGLSYGAISIAITGLTIAKKTTLIALGTFIGAALNVGLNLILIPSLKKQGAAISFLASTLLSLAAVFFFSQKHYPIPYQFRLAVAFLLLSWCLIGIDSFVLQRMPRSLALGGVRAALCLTFLPAMLRLRILRWENFISFLQFFRRSK